MINLQITPDEYQLLDCYFSTNIVFDVSHSAINLPKEEYLNCVNDNFFRKVAIKLPEANYNEFLLVTEGIPLTSNFKALLKVSSGDLSADYCFIKLKNKTVSFLNKDIINLCDLIKSLNLSRDLDEKKILTSKLLKLAIKCSLAYGLKIDESLASIAAPIVLETPILTYQDDGNGEFSFRVTDGELSDAGKSMLSKSSNRELNQFVAHETSEGIIHTFVPTPEFKKINNIVRAYDNSPKSEIENVIKKIENDFEEQNVSFDLSGYSERIQGFGIFRALPIRVLDRQSVAWFSDKDVEYHGPTLSLENGKVLAVKPSDLQKLKQQVENGLDPLYLELDGIDVLLPPDSYRELEEEINSRTLRSEDLKNLDLDSLELIKSSLNEGKWNHDKILNGDFYLPDDQEFGNELDRRLGEEVTNPTPSKRNLQALIKDNLEALGYHIQVNNNPEALDSISPPSLRKEFALKNYQVEGISKFRSIYHSSLKSGVLMADDMGLGKTLQILSFLDILYNVEKISKPTLIVVPSALVKNWNNPDDDILKPIKAKSEINKFFKENSFAVFNADSSEKVKMIPLVLKSGIQIVITTYDWISRITYEDYFFKDINWEVVCFDECQKIKNHTSKMSHASKKFKTKMIICCTATPIENDLAELWNIIDTCIPGLLGVLVEFRQRAREAYESQDTFNQFLKDIKLLIDPFMIRRLKKDIPDIDLKPKHFHLAQLPMSKAQRLAYDNVINVSKKRGMEGINALKYISLHPKLNIQTELAELNISDGGSLDWMISKISEIVARGEKVLIFSRLKIIQELLLLTLKKEFTNSIWVSRVFGETPKTKRQSLINEFKRFPGGAVFILAPDVLGFGVTLTEANHVFHVDRLWNPAKEDQATDRIYRIGQEKTVHVYLPLSSFIESKQITEYIGVDNFITRNPSTPDRKSFDEHLDSVLQRKSVLATDFFGISFFNKGEDLESVLSTEMSIETIPKV